MSKNKLDLNPEVRAFFAEIGRKNGKALYAKHGPEYFRRIAAMRKTHGRQKPKEEVKEDGGNKDTTNQG